MLCMLTIRVTVYDGMEVEDILEGIGNFYTGPSYTVLNTIRPIFVGYLRKGVCRDVSTSSCKVGRS